MSHYQSCHSSSIIHASVWLNWNSCSLVISAETVPGPFFVFSRDVRAGHTTGAQPKPTSRADKLDPTKKRQHTFTGNYCNPNYGLKVFPSVGVYKHHWLNTSSFLELGVPNSRTVKDELRSQTFFCSFFQLTAVMEYLWTLSDHSGRNLLDPSEAFKINIPIRGTKVCPYTSICIYIIYIRVYICIKKCNIHVWMFIYMDTHRIDIIQ